MNDLYITIIICATVIMFTGIVVGAMLFESERDRKHREKGYQ